MDSVIQIVCLMYQPLRNMFHPFVSFLQVVLHVSSQYTSWLPNLVWVSDPINRFLQERTHDMTVEEPLETNVFYWVRLHAM
jgi:hypothetical protein